MSNLIPQYVSDKREKKLLSSFGQETIDGFNLGNKESFSKIYDEYSVPLFKLLLIKSKDIPSAEKKLELTFIKAWHCRHAYDSDRMILWLYNISKSI